MNISENIFHNESNNENNASSQSKKYCSICQCYGVHEETAPEYLSVEKVYDEKGNTVKATLCRTHAVELFKIGQKNFFVKHHNRAQDIIVDDISNTFFFNLMFRVAQKYIYG